MTRQTTILGAMILWLLLGLLALVAVKDYQAGHAAVLRAPIIGYDPRDLLRGHYLRFQFAPNADETLRRLGAEHDYYVPETEAARLEGLLRDRSHTLTVDVRRAGKTLSFGELYVDDTPWRAYLAAHPTP